MSLERHCTRAVLGVLLWLGVAGASVVAAPAPVRDSLLGRSFVIDKASEARLAAAIEYCNTHGGTVIIYRRSARDRCR